MKRNLCSLIALCFCSVPLGAWAAGLTAEQSKELTVFGGKAMGANVGVADIKNVITGADLNKLVATGINLNQFLCATVTDIRPLKVESTYEVTCIAYRNGTAKKAYIVDALKGIAFEP